MPPAILIRAVAPADREAWFHLWAGYNAFYESTVAPHISERTWQRMLDANEPYVLDVIVPYTEHVLPFVPAGRTVADMIWRP